jgi:hypothetical protein
MNQVQAARLVDYPLSYSPPRLLPRSDFDWRAGAHILTVLAWRSLGLFLVFDSLIHYRELAAVIARTAQWYLMQDGFAQWLLGMGFTCWLIGFGLWLRVLLLTPRRHRARHARIETIR